MQSSWDKHISCNCKHNTTILPGCTHTTQGMTACHHSLPHINTGWLTWPKEIAHMSLWFFESRATIRKAARNKVFNVTGMECTLQEGKKADGIETIIFNPLWEISALYKWRKYSNSYNEQEHVFWNLFIFHRHLKREPATVVCDSVQSDLFYSAGPCRALATAKTGKTQERFREKKVNGPER